MIRRRRGLAAEADRFDLYQRSVQNPEADIELIERVFAETRDGYPLALREDFAGTAYLCAEWVRSHPERRALAVDLDPEPLEWGRRHNFTAAELERVDLVRADVREIEEPPVEIFYAPNFSFCTFDTRDALDGYLALAHRVLEEDGLFLCDLYGGTEAIVPSTEERDCNGFTYIWEQESYDPITHRTRGHIHFEMPDGSRLERAFSYDWRLWTIPEVRDSLEAASFAETLVYWEEVDDDGVGTGEFRRTEEEENQEGWLVYIVGVK